MVESVVGYCRYEARDSGDFVTTGSERGDYEAKAVLGEWHEGVDVELSA
jgi:hypothetical protein